jgi:hypothetical protein
MCDPASRGVLLHFSPNVHRTLPISAPLCAETAYLPDDRVRLPVLRPRRERFGDDAVATVVPGSEVSPMIAFVRGLERRRPYREMRAFGDKHVAGEGRGDTCLPACGGIRR